MNEDRLKNPPFKLHEENRIHEGKEKSDGGMNSGIHLF